MSDWDLIALNNLAFASWQATPKLRKSYDMTVIRISSLTQKWRRWYVLDQHAWPRNNFGIDWHAQCKIRKSFLSFCQVRKSCSALIILLIICYFPSSAVHGLSARCDWIVESEWRNGCTHPSVWKRICQINVKRCSYSLLLDLSVGSIQSDSNRQDNPSHAPQLHYKFSHHLTDCRHIFKIHICSKNMYKAQMHPAQSPAEFEGSGVLGIFFGIFW